MTPFIYDRNEPNEAFLSLHDLTDVELVEPLDFDTPYWAMWNGVVIWVE